jgi:hypothetical protein
MVIYIPHSVRISACALRKDAVLAAVVTFHKKSKAPA